MSRSSCRRHDEAQGGAQRAGGERARAETYAVAYHRKELADGSGHDDVFGIRYVDRMERRDGAWRRIVVQVARPNTITRTKRGYYAPAAH